MIKSLILRGNNMRDLNDMMIISKYESLQECRKWCGRLPAFNFDKE